MTGKTHSPTLEEDITREAQELYKGNKEHHAADAKPNGSVSAERVQREDKRIDSKQMYLTGLFNLAATKFGGSSGLYDAKTAEEKAGDIYKFMQDNILSENALPGVPNPYYDDVKLMVSAKGKKSYSELDTYDKAIVDLLLGVSRQSFMRAVQNYGMTHEAIQRGVHTQALMQPLMERHQQAAISDVDQDNLGKLVDDISAKYGFTASDQWKTYDRAAQLVLAERTGQLNSQYFIQRSGFKPKDNKPKSLKYIDDDKYH